MQVNSNYNCNKNSFGSLKLYDVALKPRYAKNSDTTLDACFSLLGSDMEDIPYVSSQKKIWSKQEYGKNIIEDFLNMQSFFGFANRRTGFYAIERFMPIKVNGVEKKQKQIYGLAEVVDQGDFLQITFLQSSSKLPNFKEKVKGVGKMLLYGIVKEAKRKGKDYITLISTADGFYKHNGWKIDDSHKGDRNCFVLYAQDYDNFLSNIENSNKQSI